MRQNPALDVGTAFDEVSTQRVGGLVVIPEMLREFGVDPGAIAARAGLDPALLESPEKTIPYDAMGRLFGECAAATRWQNFGLLAGQRANLGHLGVLGQLMKHSRTLGTALRAFSEFQHLHSRGGVTFLLEKEQPLATLYYAIYEKNVEHIDQIYDGIMAMACNVVRDLCGTAWGPSEVVFAHARPVEVGPYRRFFRAPCRFNSDQTALRFGTSLLEHRISSADPEVLLTLTHQIQARDRFELVPRLRRVLRALLVAGTSARDDVVPILLMHRRTLNRRLKAQGTTFQQVLDEIRFAAACQLLDATNISITEIGASLGYSETSAFTRAFRRWSGMSPIQRRRSKQI